MVFEVKKEDSGLRLDVFLAARQPDLTRARIKNLIDKGLAGVDGVPAKAGRRLKDGQTVTLEVPDAQPTDLTPDRDVAFEILYQDADIIVINKPPGLVVHPAAGHAEGTLVHGLLAVVEDLPGVGGEIRPGIVHRLDKDTSGVMVAAKTDAAHQALTAAFKGRGVDKAYLAICRGGPTKDRGIIDAPIGRHPIRRKEMSTRSKSGRTARTGYEVLDRFKMGACLVRLTLYTGRTHQIRVHLASLGCPVLGDPLYGRAGPGGLKDPEGRIRSLVNRQMLHSHKLGFAHPVSGERVDFEAPCPEDMVLVLAALEDG